MAFLVQIPEAEVLHLGDLAGGLGGLQVNRLSAKVIPHLESPGYNEHHETGAKGKRKLQEAEVENNHKVHIVLLCYEVINTNDEILNGVQDLNQQVKIFMKGIGREEGE